MRFYIRPRNELNSDADDDWEFEGDKRDLPEKILASAICDVKLSFVPDEDSGCAEPRREHRELIERIVRESLVQHNIPVFGGEPKFPLKFGVNLSRNVKFRRFKAILEGFDPEALTPMQNIDLDGHKYNYTVYDISSEEQRKRLYQRISD